MTIEKIVEGLDAKPQSDGNFRANCPAHEDSNQQLYFSSKGDQVLLCCHGDCTFEVVQATLVDMDLLGRFAKAAPYKPDIWLDFDDVLVGKFGARLESPRYKLLKIYPYSGEDGKIVGFKARFSPEKLLAFNYFGLSNSRPTRKITFPPYRWPETLEALKNGKPVHILEREEDADRAAAIGLHSTCFGTGNDPLPVSFIPALKESRCVIWVSSNVDRAIKVANRLHALGCTVKVAQVPKEMHFTAWIDSGLKNLKKSIDALCEGTVIYTPPVEQMKAAAEAGIMPPMSYDLGTEAFAGEYYMHKFGDKLRYVTPLDQWYKFDGIVWARDTKMVHRELAKSLCRHIREDMGRFSIDQRPALEKLAGKVQTDSGARAVLSMAKSVQPIEQTELDGHATQNLFNCASGIYNFANKDQILEAHSPDLLMTISSPIRVNFNHRAVKFLKFLNAVWPHHPEVVTYMLYFLGYCMTGSTSFHRFQNWTGEKGTGKSTIQKLMRALMGNYCGDISAESLRETKQRSAGTDSDLAQMAGKRLIFASELSHKHRLDEHLIKALTGQDPVRVKLMHQDKFNLQALAKLVFTCNERPPYSDDDAFGSRLQEIKFTQVFRGTSAEISDYEKILLHDEGDGIAALLLEMGAEVIESDCKILKEEPQIILEWSNEAREEANNVKLWAEERLQDWISGWESSIELFDDFDLFCKNKIRVPNELSIKMFGRRMVKLGYKPAVADNRRGYANVKLRPKV